MVWLFKYLVFAINDNYLSAIYYCTTPLPPPRCLLSIHRKKKKLWQLSGHRLQTRNCGIIACKRVARHRNRCSGDTVLDLKWRTPQSSAARTASRYATKAVVNIFKKWFLHAFKAECRKIVYWHRVPRPVSYI